MTDDFQLFDQSSADPVDPDVALVTAYLARELSPVQIVAVEDRLASDAAFLTKVKPILDAWVLPAALGAAHAGLGPLSRDEVESGWARYVGERAELDAHEGPRLVVDGAQRKRRKISMVRIAAGIAAITLPVVTLAQVAVYVSKHPELPGNGIAKQVVAPFVAAAPTPPPKVVPDKPVPPAEDVRIPRELKKAPPTTQRVASAIVVPPLPVELPKPDRAKMISLAQKNMPQVVSGDTTANYIVLLFDAAGDYLWGTYGTGSVSIEVAGDTRTEAERLAYARQYMVEYRGTAAGAGGGRGGAAGGGMGARGGVGTAGGGGRARSGTGTVADTAALKGALARVMDSAQRVTGSLNDSLRMSVTRVGGGAGARGGGGGGAGGAIFSRQPGDTTTRINYSVAYPRSQMSTVIADYTATDSIGAVYRLGFGWMQNGQLINVNEAAGLQSPGNGESGIQSLKSTSIVHAEAYQFFAGQLAPHGVRLYAVYLAPGVKWKGR